MAKRRIPKPKPLIPHIKKGVVIVRIPKGTSPAERNKASAAARAIAKKICLKHEKDHWYEKGDWRAVFN